MGFFRAIAWLVYQALQLILLGLSVPYYAFSRGGKGVGHYWPTLRGRAGLSPIYGDRPNQTERLWIHAVSVGEVGVAATLVARLPADLPLVITTVTPTGQAHGKKLLGGKAFAGRDVELTYLPFDFAWTVRRFRRRFRPRALVLTEGDYWPLTLSTLNRAGLPILVANGRISDRAFRRQKRIGRINGLFYDPISCFGMQTAEDRRRLIELGTAADRVHVTGNLKFDTEPPSPQPEVEAYVRDLAGDRPILIAGSTMEGEDAQVLDAFTQLGGGARALLVLVPRHPERWDRCAELVESSGFRLSRRSQLGRRGQIDPTEATESADVLLLDSLGELAALYRLAKAAFIGGTLVPTGGHNPLEPALFGVPTVVGPSMFNFQEIADAFDQAEAWGRAENGDALADIWLRWLDEPRAAEEIGRKALRLLEENRGAVDRTLQLLSPYLDRP